VRIREGKRRGWGGNAQPSSDSPASSSNIIYIKKEDNVKGTDYRYTFIYRYRYKKGAFWLSERTTTT
jgi:hypothetical protein